MPALRSNIDWKRWGKDDPLYGVTNLAQQTKRRSHGLDR